MLAAAIEDAARLRISNVTSILVLVGAIIAAIMAGPSLALWQNGAVFLLVLVIGTMAFSAGLMGGGDVKLFAAAGLWFDLRSAVSFIALVFISGGVVALCYLVSRPFRRGVRDKRDRRIPYGIAIALGALAMVLLDRGAFRHHERPLSSYASIPHRS
jgi:prepilin peptidase CpaA